MSNDDDDELFDMFMMGMFDDHSTPKRGGSGCAGCILMMGCVPVLFKILVSFMV